MPNPWEYILRLALSALFGGVIGLERELRLKGAGIRTHLIVCFASCMMTLVSKYGFLDLIEHEAIKLDPSRVAAGLVTAIGFLGAGTIFARGRGVTGLTTAAGLWATVGIGMATGSGLFLVCTFGAAFIVAVQAVLYRDHALLGHFAAVIFIQIDDQPEALDLLQVDLASLGLEACGVKYERTQGLLSVELQLDRLPCSDRELGTLLTPLMKQPYIKTVLW